MPTRTFYVYSADAFQVDPDTGDSRLKPGFQAGQDRARFDVTDDDMFADGDAGADEVGDDANQTATVYDSDGTVVSSGQFYVEEVRWYETPEGETISVTVFEIDGEVVGYSSSAPLEPGAEYTYMGSSEAGEKIGKDNNNASRNNYNTYEAASVACFGPGTMISTEQGEIPVEWLDTSDKVLTRDHGFQPILWVGRTTILPGYFDRYPDEAPVLIPAGTLAPNCPTHDLCVTGDHRLLIRSARAELLFFSAEVLGPAKAWVDAQIGIPYRPKGGFTVTHVVCASHQLIVAQGAWVETMFTGKQALRRLKLQDLNRLQKLLGPELTRQQTARPCLSRKETRALLVEERRALQDGRAGARTAAMLRA